MKPLPKKNLHLFKLKCFLSLTLALSSNVNAKEPPDLMGLSLDALTKVKVFTASRQEESLLDTSSAVFVISNMDIQRTGVTSIPEALNMVPGIHAAQIDSAKWSVGSRGLGWRYTNNLLVMVDGRSIYTPTYNGVFWEQLDIVMEDIDRIEVIRGPGATLWDNNAVNGVINIITKAAGKTQGSYVKTIVGDQNNSLTLRHGTKIDDKTYGRGYIKLRRNNHSVLSNGDDSYDAHRNQQAGFRLDKNLDEDGSITLQGDIYGADSNQVESLFLTTPPYVNNVRNVRESHGWNVLGRWKKPTSLSSHMRLQMYLDHYGTKEIAIAPNETTTFDIDFQQTHNIGAHNIVWGLGYRRSSTKLTATQTTQLMHTRIPRYNYNGFIQDEITLIQDKLTFTAGTKVKRNNTTGVEFQPNTRILWRPSTHQSIWASAARTVRTPSIAEDATRSQFASLPPSESIPLPVSAVINPPAGKFDAEKNYTYELGYRVQTTPRLSFDTVIYHTDYQDMRSLNMQGIEIITTPALTPAYAEILLDFGNNNTAHSSGLELSSKWQPTNDLGFALAYTYTKISIPDDGMIPDYTPEHKLSLRTMWDISPALNLNLWLRYESEIDAEQIMLPNGMGVQSITTLPDLPAVWNMDLRLRWRASKNVELSLVGKNLLHKQVLQGGNPFFNQQIVEIPRSVIGVVEFKF